MLSAIGFTARGQAVQDSVALLQSTNKGRCLLCDCLKGPVPEELRCVGTVFDKLMLKPRISSEKVLAMVAQEKTHACKDIQNAIGTDTAEQAMTDFVDHFDVSFEASKDKFNEVKKLYNQFAKAVYGEMAAVGSEHVGAAFDSCLEHADADMANFEGLLAIGESVFRMTPDAATKVERLHEMICLSLRFIGRFRDASYTCFKDLASGAVEILRPTPGKPLPVFMMSIVRLGLHFDVVAMEAAEEEAKLLHTELECMGKMLGIPVPPFEDPSTQIEDNVDVDLPTGYTATTKTSENKSLPAEDFPDLPEALKQLAHPRKQKMKASLERLIADIPEMRKMLNPHQNKLLDESFALARGDPLPATNETEVTN